MMPSVDKPKLPEFHAENDMPISDSCNCCQTCNVSCCFPRKARKCKKGHNVPNLDRRASVFEEKAHTVLKKSNEKN